MSLNAFLNYIAFSTERPARIHPGRWNGMLRFARTHGYLK